MIITNPDLRPKERFLQAVRPYFEEQGFRFQKGTGAFLRPFSKGTQKVWFWFRISTLVDVSLFWSVQFEKLEKLHAKVRGHPNKIKDLWTVGEDLPFYTRWLEVEHTFPLFDPKTLKYDDTSINQAAGNIIEAYQEYTIPYFSKYQDYAVIESYFNDMKFKQIRGIILAKYLENPKFETLCQTLLQQIKLRNGEGESEEMNIYNNTMELLQTSDIKKLLD